MANDRLERIKSIVTLAAGELTRADFTAAFKALAQSVVNVERQLTQRIDARLARVKDGKNGRDGKDGKTITGPMGPQGPAGESIQGPAGNDGSPDNADDIRNKLELLPEGEKLKIDAIEDLERRLDELSKLIGRARTGGGSVIAYSRGQIKLYDLSDKLDGSTKTFALPAFWRVLTVQSTSTPNAFRPTVDYNTDGNAMSITFTDQIDAASTLSAGQSLTVLYAEP